VRRLRYVDEELPVLWSAGFSVKECASLLACSDQTIRNRLRAWGLPPRPSRRPTIPADVRSRILAEHERGAGPSVIAAMLNREGIPTARGGRAWYHGTIRKALAA
jgi:hypothetical protein